MGIGGIIRMNRDGNEPRGLRPGMRNSVGMDFNPKDKTLWFTDNQIDGMGDDTPPGELNRITKAGQNFGYPVVRRRQGRAPTAVQGPSRPADVVIPQVETDAHAADLGMTFYNGNMFPAKYQGGIFVAQHGSWNRTTPVGARIMFTRVSPTARRPGTEVFAAGWLDDKTGEYLGRPVDVQQYLDGSLLVSDDTAGPSTASRIRAQ